MSPLDLNGLLALQERELEDARERITKLATRLASTEQRGKELRDDLGEGADGMALPLGPLYAALVGAVAANAALFFAFVEWMTHFDEPIWNLGMFASVAIGVTSLPYSSKSGAGGRARIGLRFVTMAALAVAVIIIVIVVARIAIRRAALHI